MKILDKKISLCLLLTFVLVFTMMYIPQSVFAKGATDTQSTNKSIDKSDVSPAKPLNSGKDNNSTAKNISVQSKNTSNALSDSKGSTSNKKITSNKINSKNKSDSKTISNKKSQRVSGVKNSQETKKVNSNTTVAEPPQNDSANENSNVQSEDSQNGFDFIKSEKFKKTFFDSENLLLYVGVFMILISVIGLFFTFKYKGKSERYI